MDMLRHFVFATKNESVHEFCHFPDELFREVEHVTDLAGVPLLHSDKSSAVWEAQKKHLLCIQDPPGVTLYTNIGTLKKIDVTLPVYRCGRGSSSLESFHLHLARFIPGS